MDYLARALDAVADWRAAAGPLPSHPALAPDPERFEAAFAEFSERMAGSYPFHHPRYAGQMLKPPHPVAIAAYTAAMHVNSNNHALDGGPATSALEVEVIRDLARMFGFPEDALGHLTSSGTIANLEALWVARELHPEQGDRVRLQRPLHALADVRRARRRGRSPPTTSRPRARRGASAPSSSPRARPASAPSTPSRRRCAGAPSYGVRVHVDAAYGGFFTLLDELVPVRSFRAIADADSVVVDPHKHGLQPYGCGAVLFRDPGVGRLYKHDSPYTYFTSGDLHLGEISLECSRAGAAAAALWLTLRSLDLAPILAAGVRAARAWAALIARLRRAAPAHRAAARHRQLLPDRPRASEIDAASERVLNAGMTAEDPVYLSTLRIDGAAFAALHPDVEMDVDGVRVLRSVLMKPEHEPFVPWLHERVTSIARR